MTIASRSAIRRFSLLSAPKKARSFISLYLVNPWHSHTFLGSQKFWSSSMAPADEEMVQRIGTRKRQLARRVAWALGSTADFWLQISKWTAWVVTKELKRKGKLMEHDETWWKLDGNLMDTWWKSIQDSRRTQSSQLFQPKMLKKWIRQGLGSWENVDKCPTRHDSTRKLIVVRCIRPDRVLPAVQVFVVPGQNWSQLFCRWQLSRVLVVWFWSWFRTGSLNGITNKGLTMDQSYPSWINIGSL